MKKKKYVARKRNSTWYVFFNGLVTLFLPYQIYNGIDSGCIHWGRVSEACYGSSPIIFSFGILFRLILFFYFGRELYRAFKK